MKKRLLSSLGVFVLCSVSAQAAEPIKLSISGKMEQWFGYADNDVEGYAKVDQQSNANVNFAGKTTLDNGLTVGVLVETQATQKASGQSKGGENKNIKYSYGYISGNFGMLSLGQQKNISAKLMHAAPAYGLTAQDGDWMNWVVQIDNKAQYKTYINDDRAADKINYTTPSWNGLQAGFSYVPDTGIDGQVGKTSMASQYATNGADYSNGDMYVFGVAYDNEFSNGVKLGANVGYTVGNLAQKTSEYQFDAVQAGLSASYSGFTVGGSYLNRSSDEKREVATAAGDIWDVGIAYDAKPWGVSLSYLSGTTTVGALGEEDEVKEISLAGKYDIGPGVALTGTIVRAEYDSDIEDKNRQNEGWAVVSSILVKF